MAGKDGQQHIPNEVESMIKDVLNHFKYSAVSPSQFKAIMELSKEKYVNLVSYHKVRWLSLKECVQRSEQLHSVLSLLDPGIVHPGMPAVLTLLV